MALAGGIWAGIFGLAAFGAENAYYAVPVDKLEVTGGKLLEQEYLSGYFFLFGEGVAPYVLLEGQGEAYVGESSINQRPASIRMQEEVPIVVVCAPSDQPVKGKLFLPTRSSGSLTNYSFTIPANAAKTDARSNFFAVKRDYYLQLTDRSIPGTAWFRYQASEAGKALGITNTTDAGRMNFRRMRADEEDETYDLFSGGRAVSENLQLDRDLQRVGTGQPTVDITNLQGITVREMDWQGLIKDAKPELDPLAACIPADQHAIFFPSFAAMTRVLDEADSNGTPMLEMLEPRGEDRDCRGRYQKQMCLDLSAISRVLGPQVVESVAFTGSDPYLRTGTDVGIVLEARSPELVRTQVIANQAKAAGQNAEAKAVKGDIDGVAYVGLVSPDRTISSYLAGKDREIFICNSLVQLRKLLATASGKNPSLAAQNEYVFFRSRYSRADKDEAAFLVLSDPAIRRWCGPVSRIAASRRTRVAAVMADLQAAHLDELVHGKAAAAPLKSDFLPPEAGELSLAKHGVVSSVYGSLDFLTPISELNITKVTQAEADSYKRWRDSYQQNWSQYFDPIAARFTMNSNRAGLEVTVMPLIIRSEYAEISSVTKGATLAPTAGDPHSNTVAHLAVAINADSEPVKQAANFLGSISPAMKANALGWLGQSIALYADDDPFWAELAQAKDKDEFMQKQYSKLPAALYCEVRNPLGLAAFLTALRGMAQQTAPGMTKWQDLEYNGQPYVKVSSMENPGAEEGGQNISVYYVTTPKSLTVSLNENVLKHAIDRQATQGSNGPSSAVVMNPWLGTNLCLKLDRKIIETLQTLDLQDRGSGASEAQLLAWGNIPILNEWKRRYPEEDPVKLQENFWQTKLVAPGGGAYVWNEKWRTMESTLYGHPGEPKEGPASFGLITGILAAEFGLNFENQGISAKAIMIRDRSAQ